MKVLVAHSNLNAGGGAEVYAHAILQRLRAHCHDIGILDVNGHTPPNGQTYRPAWFRIADLPGMRGKSLLSYALVCRALPRIALQYDAVILSYGEGPTLPRATMALHHAPIIFSPDPEDLRVLQDGLSGWLLVARQAYTGLCRWLARPCPAASNCIIANSEWTSARLRERAGVNAAATIYPRLETPQPVAVPRDPYRFLALGRIVENKRLEDAIVVLRGLRSKGIPATLEIMGRANGPYAQAFLQSHSDEPGLILSPNASDEDKARAIAQARFGIHCYRAEHFGIAVAEMIAGGVVPLVFDDGGVRELVGPRCLRFTGTRQLTEQAVALCVRGPALTNGLARRLRRGTAFRRALAFETAIDECLRNFLASA